MLLNEGLNELNRYPLRLEMSWKTPEFWVWLYVG